jgi:4-amino-4-deoxy-L-arabinose transferase-like glycosyltransferase
MVACRDRGRRHGIGVELRDLVALCVARQVTCAKTHWPVLIGLGILFALRFWLAAVLPLNFDEAYYWLWSQHLAAGYYDHPPMVALVIRLSTLLFGDSPLGIRMVSVLLGIPVTWAIWRTADILFGDTRLSARAALYFNLTLLAGVGTLIVTPDSPLLLFTALTLYCLASLWKSEDYRWWLPIGVAVGLGLVSKYTAFFTGASIALWLALAPQMRRWLFTPWPWASGLLAFAIFSPVLLWNEAHDFASFSKQFGRVVPHGFTLSYEAEYVGALCGLLTPPIFFLGATGLRKFLAKGNRAKTEYMLLILFTLPLLAYFFWHALHARVQPNWFLPVFPAVAIAAAWETRAPRLRAAVVPFGFTLWGIAAVLALHPPPDEHLDFTGRKLGYGWDSASAEIEKLRAAAGTETILTNGYALVSWLSYYTPGHPLVVPLTQPIRWVNFDLPDVSALRAPMLYVTDEKRDLASDFPVTGAKLTLLEKLPRLAHGHEVEELRIYRVTRD